MKRVLIGHFGAIATLGFREVLEETCEIVAEGTATEDIITGVRQMRPDVVVLDSDTGTSHDAAVLLARAEPGVTVIGCSLSRPMLEVFTGAGTSYTTELSPMSLLEAVNRR